VKILLAALFSLIGLATTLANATNSVSPSTGSNVRTSNPDDPIEKEYRQLMEDDDAAQDEVDRWIKENHAAKEKGAADFTLPTRITQRLDKVRSGYEDFLRRHPKHVHARIAFASFLNDLGEEENSVAQLERAREIDPKEPAIWNNLANYYGHHSPVKKAFEYYAKAIELSPNQSVYYQNLANTVFLFRKDAMEFYNASLPQVFDRSLDLYRKALKLDPENFVLASDYAQSFYGIRPLRMEEAIAAWEAASKIAKDDDQRQGVQVHLARLKLGADRLEEARQHLAAVTNGVYSEIKEVLTKNLDEKAKRTDAPKPAESSGGPAEEPKAPGPAQ